jgi:hypothetical protein
LIERFLTLERKRQLVEAQIKALRNVAHIEYRGKFAEAVDKSEKSGATGEHGTVEKAAPGPDSVALGKGVSALK